MSKSSLLKAPGSCSSQKYIVPADGMLVGRWWWWRIVLGVLEMDSQKKRQGASVPGRSAARHDVINGFTVSRIITVVQPAGCW